MKPTPAFLAASLVANAGLIGLLAARPALAPPAFRDFFTRHFHAADDAAAPTPAAAHPAPAPRRKLWPAIDTGDDLTGLIARLRAAGFPASTIRMIVSTQVSARYDARLRALQEPDPNVPFWKQRAPFFGPGDKRLEEMNQLSRERARVLRDLFKDDFFATDDVSAAQRRRFGNLSPQKIEQLERIEDDYNEMNSSIRAAMNGITLPEDRDKLALLAKEKHADLAAILTPEELADYELRNSPITNFLRNRLGGFDPTEAEFRAFFAAQQALNDKFPGGATGAADYQARQDAQKAYADQLRAALGAARWADYVRENDRDYQMLNRVAQRENIPRDAIMQAYGVRDTVERESNRIFDDAALSPDQKRAALQTLAQNARGQLTGLLGPVAGPGYVKAADQWLNQVERGAAVSFQESIPFSIVNEIGGTMTYLGGPRFRSLPNPRPRP